MNPTLAQTPETHMKYWSALATGLVAAAIYWFTTSLSANFADSAELALSASQLGATHAPGAPLHTLIGYVLSTLLDDPALATALLSLIAASVAAAIVTCITSTLTSGSLLPFAAGAIYAFLYPIWESAVGIELYSLSAMFIAASILASRLWLLQGSSGFPVAMTIAYACALSAHFANILLLPAYFWLLLTSCGWRDPRPYLFGLACGGAIATIALANVLLTINVPPLAQYIPDSLIGLLAYMAGTEHAPLEVRNLTEFSNRLHQHTLIFSRNFLYIGIVLLLIGVYRSFRTDAQFSGFLLLVFLLNFGYFTFFGSGDYFLMVSTAYLVGSLWLAQGTALLTLHQKLPQLIIVLFAGGLVVLQFSGFRTQSKSTAAADYAAETFRSLPTNSVAIARWNEFTVLNYYQQIGKLREDLKFILPSRSLRLYSHGHVADYLEYVELHICTQSVVTNKLTPELEASYKIDPVPGTNNWKLVMRKQNQPCPK
jgi:Protein of unknown function (DUF2723)